MWYFVRWSQALEQTKNSKLNTVFTMLFILSSIFLLSILYLPISFTSPPQLFSLKCTSSFSNQTDNHHTVDPITTLIDNLTSKAAESHLTTLNITFGQKQYTGLLQCRPGLSPNKCSICTKAARNSISPLCRSSDTVSSWFDGCYVQIMPTMSFKTAHVYMNISNHSCAVRAIDQGLALGALFLKLRADVNIPTHHGFSHGEISYNSPNRSKIYGLVECVRLLSPEECDSCVEKAVEKLEFYCSGKKGGFVVHGPCLVRFDSDRFYDGGRAVTSYAGAGVSRNFTVWEGENGDKRGGWKAKLVMSYWGGGVACFVVFVLLVCLLRKAVLNRAKVGTL